MSLLQLFLTMMKIGALTFGGGFGALEMFRVEFAALAPPLLFQDEYLQLSSFAAVNPWSTGVTGAFFIGMKEHGVPGALIAAAGMLLPTVLLGVLIVLVGVRYAGNPYVKRPLQYMSAMTVAYIGSAAFLFLIAAFSYDMIFFPMIAGVACFCNIKFNIRPVYLLAGGFVLGAVMLF